MYKRGDKTLRDDVPGEGLVLWVDATNVIYELDWYTVDDVTPDGWVSCHFWWFDGEKPRCARACLSPAVTRPGARPQPSGDGILTAARRLLLALSRLDEGSDNPGFAGWQNGNGEPVGDEVEAARAELAALLGIEYPAPQPGTADEKEK